MNGLSPQEQFFLSNARSGVPTRFPPETMPPVRASVIRALCLDAKIVSAGTCVHLQGATIIGTLDLSWLTLGSALTFVDCYFKAPLLAHDCALPGMELRKCCINGLSGSRMKTTGNLDLAHLQCRGKLDLADAHIGADLILSGAAVVNKGGVALNANSISVGMSIHLNAGFSSVGSINLVFAKIGGQLVFRGGAIYHSRFLDYALDAEHLRAGSHVIFDDGFACHGTINLQYAEIGGALNFSTAIVGRHPLELALRCNYISVKSELALTTSEIVGSLELVNGTVGVLRDSGLVPRTKLSLEGFRYGAIHPLSPTSVAHRLDWLRAQPAYNSSSYEQLANFYSSRGEIELAKEVLIAKHNDRPAHFPRSLAKWFLHTTIAHGYRPSRALFPAVFLIASGAILFRNAEEHGLMIPTTAVITTNESTRCSPNSAPCFEPLVYTLDVFLPIVDLRQQEFWLPNHREGFQYAVLMWILIALGWILTTVLVLGFTGRFKI